MKIINVDIKKKTIQAAYSQVMLLNKLDFCQHQKGEPLYDLVMEIKRSIKRNNKFTKSKENFINNYISYISVLFYKKFE